MSNDEVLSECQRSPRSATQSLRLAAKRVKSSILVERVAEDAFVHVERDLRRYRDGDCIARAAVDLDEFAFVPNPQLRVIGVFLQVVDDHILNIAAHRIDGGHDQIVRERAGRRFAFDAAIDAMRLEQADDNRETAVSLEFLQDDELRIVDLADDDPLEFHLNRHGKLAFDQFWARLQSRL